MAESNHELAIKSSNLAKYYELPICDCAHTEGMLTIHVKIPRFNGDIMKGPSCAAKLLKGATIEELTFHCPMRCHTSTLLVVTEIKDDEFILTHAKSPVVSTCPDNQTTFPEEMTAVPGALKITVPCQCSLNFIKIFWKFFRLGPRN